MITVSSPRDLPDLRLALLDEWCLDRRRRADGTVRPGAYQVLGELARAPFGRTDDRFVHYDARFDVPALKRAELWWVTPELSTLISHAAKSLPPTTLTKDLVPDRPVMVWFAQPLMGTDVLSGATSAVQMMLWDYTVNADLHEEALTIALYGPCVGAIDLPLWPLGRTDWLLGSDTDEPSFEKKPSGDELLIESMAEDRRWAAALALLASQPLAERSPVPVPRATARRSQRAKTPSEVVLVDLRAPRRPVGRSDDHRVVEWSHRWIVGGGTGGFWRQQAYGPNHSLRRPKWIMPFVKGPDDKPLIVKDTVKIVRD